MLESRLFAPTRKTVSRDDVSANAMWLLRAGYVEKLMAGVYTLWPLGLMVLRNIERIIREAMNALGAQELLLPALTPRAIWDATGRWSTLASIMHQFKDHAGHEIGLAPTHEDVITDFLRHHVASYRDLPLALYQIQTKYRDEPRAKSGLIRLREFIMKDLYSFHATESDLDAFYEKVSGAYQTIFRRCGLKTLVIEASGGDFTQTHSHEFSVLTDAGEDHVLFCSACSFAQNREIATVRAGDRCPNGDGVLKEAKAVEVGNIFKLGTRFSASLRATFRDTQGRAHPIIMASYGIGPGRVLGTIVEVHHDDKGIIWPVAVTPFLATIIPIGETAVAKSTAFYETCQKQGLPVLYADRPGSPGEKFATADLLGFPVRIVFSAKTGDAVEWKERTGPPELVTTTEAIKRLRALVT